MEEETLLDLYLFHRTGRLPAGQTMAELHLTQKRSLATLLAILGDMTGLEERIRKSQHLRTLRSLPDLDVLPDGMVYRLQQCGIDPADEARKRRAKMIARIERELLEE